MTKNEYRKLQEIRRCATFETACFSGIAVPYGATPLPKSEAEVDAFIRERTRIFRESWILAALDELLAGTPE